MTSAIGIRIAANNSNENSARIFGQQRAQICRSRETGDIAPIVN
jgi:hypothetical protein